MCEKKNFNVQTKIICIFKKVPKRHYISIQTVYLQLDFRFHPKNTNIYSPNTNLVHKKIRGDSILEQLLRKGMLYAEFVPLKINTCSAFPPLLGKNFSESAFVLGQAKTTCIRQERLCFNIGFILIHIIHIPLTTTSNYCTYQRLLTVNMRYLVIKDTSFFFY